MGTMTIITLFGKTLYLVKYLKEYMILKMYLDFKRFSLPYKSIVLTNE